MAESHVISALVRKRALLASELGKLERRRREIKGRLGGLDNALREFGYCGDPGAIGALIRHQRMFGRGGLRRLVTDIVAQSNRPLSNRQIAQIIIRKMDWQIADSDLLYRVTDNVGTVRRNTKLP